MTLYVVPTPIGNLEDVTLRALRVLREVSLILAEDTRQTRKLLTRYEIATPLLSYHEHNKLARLDRALEALRQGDVALVSDSGMPAISDPGIELIQAAVDAEIPVDVLPGPSAVVTAVASAAMHEPGFLFAGFLPRKPSERRASLRALAGLEYPLVFYEAPHRLLASLRDMQAELGDRPMVAARELTKAHQEVLRGTIGEIEQHFCEVEPRGEFTLVLAAGQAGAPDGEEGARELVQHLHAAGADSRSAVAAVMAATGISRNEAYRLWLAGGKTAR